MRWGIFILISVALLCAEVHGKKLDPDATMVKHGKFSYLLYAPADLDLSQEHPLMVVLHQKGGRCTSLFPAWKETADKYGYILAFPNSKYCRRWTNKDGLNVLNMIEEVRGTYLIDRTRIHLSGFSMGAGFAYHLLQMRPDLFASVSPHASVMASRDKVVYRELEKGFTKTKVCMFHGSRDSKVYLRESAPARVILKNLGVPLEFKTFPIGHAFPEWLPEEIIKCVENRPDEKS